MAIIKLYVWLLVSDTVALNSGQCGSELSEYSHWRVSGKPVASWCLENNINRNSFYKWRRIIHPEVDLVTGAIAGNYNDSCFFTHVVVVPQTRKISITINGAELTFDESLLSKVIEAIK